MSNWISSEIEKPEEYKDGLGGYSKNVLVTDGKDVWLSAWWEPLNRWNDDEEIITHWQHLPSPPSTLQDSINLDNSWIN